MDDDDDDDDDTFEGAPLEVTQLANTYNDLRARLAKSWSDQRRFVSAVSHELRTPLTIVQGYLHRTLTARRQPH